MGRKAWFVYGGSEPEYRADMPNYLLQWTMIRDALRAGCTLYDFRGVEGIVDRDGNPVEPLSTNCSTILLPARNI